MYADSSVYVPGKRLEEKDWIGMTLDDLKKKVEPALQVLSAQQPGYFYTSYDVSKVFEDNSNSNTLMHYKHIFIRYIIQIDNDNFTCYKQYTFKREGNDYVLFSIRNLNSDMNKELMYGSEKVEFIKNIIFE